MFSKTSRCLIKPIHYQIEAANESGPQRCGASLNSQGANISLALTMLS